MEDLILLLMLMLFLELIFLLVLLVLHSSGVDHLAVVENTAVKASAAPPPGIFDPCEVAKVAAAAVAVETASGPYPV